MGNSESSARFRGLVLSLQESAVPEDAPFWSNFWTVPTRPEEVFTFITILDIRTILEKQPQNVKTLLAKIIDFISVNISNLDDPIAHQHLDNALTCLTRIIPVLYEHEEEPNFSILFDETKKIVDGQEFILPPIIIRVFHLLKTLLFMPGFTSPENSENPVWFSGIYNDTLITLDPASFSQTFEGHKLSLLRLMLALMSQTVFFGSNEFDSKENRFAHMFCERIVDKDFRVKENGRSYDLKFSQRKQLFDSLLNGFLQFDPNNVGGRFFSRGSAVVSEEIGSLCLQLILALVDYSPLDSRSSNSFAAYLSMFVETATEDQSRIVFRAFTRHLHYASTQISQKKAATDSLDHQEVLTLLWKILTAVNKISDSSLLSNIYEHENVMEWFIPLFVILWEGRKRATDVGLVHLCIFLLLVLSSHRQFSLQLSKKVSSTLSVSEFPVAMGRASALNHADLLVVLIYKLVVDGHESLKKLYSCLATILCNISPYVSDLNVFSCTKILELFTMFRKRNAFFFILPLFLDLFNNIIQYQFATNLSFIYTLCSYSGEFEAMLFDLSSDAVEPEMVETLQRKSGTVKALLDYLVPEIEKCCKPEDGVADEQTVMKFLRTTTVVGVLPVPHAIVIRKYEPNDYTKLWFTTFLWGVLFIRNKEYPLWDETKVQLFSVDIVDN